MKVKCPTCKNLTEYGPDNMFRPFCSERCRTLDLGAWADEKYRVPLEKTTPDEDADAAYEDEKDPSNPPPK